MKGIKRYISRSLVMSLRLNYWMYVHRGVTAFELYGIMDRLLWELKLVSVKFDTIFLILYSIHFALGTNCVIK